MQVREFVIPGKIQAKQRPRFANGRVYTPTNTVNYESFVKVCYSDYARHHSWDTLKGEIRAEIEILMPVPKSDTKKKKELKLSRKMRPTSKPDVDNCIKSILDALNGIAFVDDSQVVSCNVDKYYSDFAQVRVKLYELAGE